MDKMICTMEYYPVTKNNKIMPFAATQMDLETIIINEERKRKTDIVWCHLYVESTKMMQMNLFVKQKQTHRLLKQTYDYQRGNVGRQG